MLDHQNDQLAATADQLSEQWVEAWGKSRILQESRKPFLAILAKEASEADGGKMSAAAAEREALASPRYREFFKGMVEAEREEKRLGLLYENHKLKYMKS